jgi:hypothetical protein
MAAICAHCKCDNIVGQATRRHVPLFNYHKGTSDACLHCRIFSRDSSELDDCRALYKGILCCCTCHDDAQNNCVLATYKFCFTCIDNSHFFHHSVIEKSLQPHCNCDCHVDKDSCNGKNFKRHYAAVACAALVISAVAVCVYACRQH